MMFDILKLPTMSTRGSMVVLGRPQTEVRVVLLRERMKKNVGRSASKFQQSKGVNPHRPLFDQSFLPILLVGDVLF